MARRRKWRFDADYFTFCNCDWGCPCNFNAPPTQGTCHGVGAWRIHHGQFDGTKLDGAVFALAYFFPGLIEQGNGIARGYVDRKTTTPDQRRALEEILAGHAGGGMFEIFANLTKTFLPTKVVDIDLHITDGTGTFRIDDLAEAESILLSYPDGLTLYPRLTLPHGIEFKEALATNAKRWWIRDEAMVDDQRNRYAAVARVKFTEKGCVG